ncbi:MAG: CRISPR-associated endonuclease Cas2 [Pseudomonadota bacterium]
MARRRILVAYDITCDRRRDRVFRTLNDFGDSIQYSVFLCDMNEREIIELRSRISTVLNHAEDQVLVVDLGLADQHAANRIVSIGRAFRPRERVIVV